MVRKADRLGFYQVVQCRPRWLLRIRNVFVACQLFLRIVMRFRDNRGRGGFLFYSNTAVTGEQLVAECS